jgi:hypothetical protein
MKKLGILGVMLPMLAALPQASNAAVYTIDELGTTESAPGTVLLDVRNEGSNTVTVNVSLGSGTVADIQGIFFNFDGYPDGIHVVNGTGSTGFLYS